MKKEIYNVFSEKDCKKLLNHPLFFSITLVNYSSMVENSLFEGCQFLENVIGTFETRTIGKRAFANCSNLKRFDASIEEIGPEAFAFCNNLKDFNFSRLKILSNSSFRFSGLKSADFAKEIIKIPENCFSNCFELENIGFNQVETIEKSAFENCIKLKYIILEDQLKWIGPLAFAGCIFLSTIYCTSEVPPKIYSNTFNNCFIKKIVVKNKRALENYSKAPTWKKYRNLIQIKD